MNYTPIGAQKDGMVFDVTSLYAHLSLLEDHRKTRGKRYPLALVLILLVLAKLCGQDTPFAIAEWTKLRCRELVHILRLSRQTVPCDNTYRRVLRGAVDMAELEGVVGRYLSTTLDQSQSMLIVMDGKTLRGTIPQGTSQGVHLLAAYVPAEGVVLMQLAVDGKENEIVAAPQLLEVLDLRHKVVRGDALHTQRELSLQIVQAGGDYVWEVKGNQPNLLADIREVFDPMPTAAGWGQAPRDLRRAEKANSGHGRLEKRTLTASRFLNEYSDWPGLAQVFKLEREAVIQSTGEVRREITYGITSLSPEEASPSRLLEFMRDYWDIENGLHYRRDKTLGEDATRMTHWIQAEAVAILNNLVIALVRRQGRKNLAAARRYYDARITEALQLLLEAPT